MNGILSTLTNRDRARQRTARVEARQAGKRSSQRTRRKEARQAAKTARQEKRQAGRTSRQAARQRTKMARIEAKGASGYWSPAAVQARSGAVSSGIDAAASTASDIWGNQATTADTTAGTTSTDSTESEEWGTATIALVGIAAAGLLWQILK